MLGEYLRECNIGGAHRKNLGEHEMRRIVLYELNQVVRVANAA